MSSKGAVCNLAFSTMTENVTKEDVKDMTSVSLMLAFNVPVCTMS